MIKTKKTKSKQVTRKIIKVGGMREFIDPETGEKIDQYVLNMEERDANFHKVWLWHLAEALELIGNQKMKILSYIFENAKDNLFVGTQRMIAEATETAYQTVSITMKLLMEADIIKLRHAGVYLINSDVIFKGGTNKRMNILYEYYSVNKKSKE